VTVIYEVCAVAGAVAAVLWLAAVAALLVVWRRVGGGALREVRQAQQIAASMGASVLSRPRR